MSLSESSSDLIRKERQMPTPALDRQAIKSAVLTSAVLATAATGSSFVSTATASATTAAQPIAAQPSAAQLGAAQPSAATATNAITQAPKLSGVLGKGLSLAAKKFLWMTAATAIGTGTYYVATRPSHDVDTQAASGHVLSMRSTSHAVAPSELGTREVSGETPVVVEPHGAPTAISHTSIETHTPGRTTQSDRAIESDQVPTPAAQSTLVAELASLERIEDLLTAGDAVSAQTLLSDHRHRFRQRLLAQEFDAMTALATCLQSSRGRTRALERFTSRHPNSLLLARVARACAE